MFYSKIHSLFKIDGLKKSLIKKTSKTIIFLKRGTIFSSSRTFLKVQTRDRLIFRPIQTPTEVSLKTTQNLHKSRIRSHILLSFHLKGSKSFSPYPLVFNSISEKHHLFNGNLIQKF